MHIEGEKWILKKYTDPSSPMIWIFRKNEAPGVVPGSTSHSHVCYLTFNYAPGDERGLPSPQDARRLESIEIEDIPHLENERLSVLVAVVLKDGIKDFIFYTREPNKFLALASKIRLAYPDFDVGCEVGPDPSWSHYKDIP